MSDRINATSSAPPTDSMNSASATLSSPCLTPSCTCANRAASTEAPSSPAPAPAPATAPALAMALALALALLPSEPAGPAFLERVVLLASPPSTSSTSPSAPTHYDYSSLSQSATYSAETLKRLGLSGGDLITSEKTLFYLLDQNTRRHIPDLATFLRHGWEFADAHRLSEEDLNAIRVGPDVD
mmetsp:Transcript_14260/g.31247  ORF Transcript_14260/g.31247 Transcript_14260/m.31247 type:complete len:184 (-) Transcript_14260:2521-3072(-)